MTERPLTTINQAGEDSTPVFDVEEPTDGQVLAYDGDSGKWKNADAGGGSGGGVLVLHYDSDVNGVDKTWQEIYDAAAAGQVVLYQTILSETQATAWFLGNVELFNGTYSVTFYQGSQSEVLYADSANGKPHYMDS